MRPPPWRVQPLARRRPVRSRWCLPPRLDGAQPGPDGPRPRRGGLGELLEAARLAPLDLDRGEHAVAEPVGALRARGDGEVMGDDDERGAVLVALALQKVHHQGASVDVESAGGLVGEDDPGPPGKRPGDGDALLLAAGEPLDGRADPVAQPDGLQELLGTLHPGPEGLPRVIEERGGHVLRGAQAWDEVEGLEDVAEGPPSQEGSARLPEAVGRDAVDLVVPRRRHVDEAEEVEEGGLAGARAPDDRQVLPGAHVQVDAGEDMQGWGIGDVEGPRDAPHGQQGPVRGVSAPLTGSPCRSRRSTRSCPARRCWGCRCAARPCPARR